MAAYDFTSPRLFVPADLTAGEAIALDRGQANYLLSVLRLGSGEEVLAFNGRDGEWRAEIQRSGRKAAALVPLAQTRPQASAPDLDLLFAPLKHARLDFSVQKATEMGVGRLRPVITRRTIASRVNADRMRANVIEAAEQCGILAVPDVMAETDLATALGELGRERLIVFCDEEARLANPIEALAGVDGRTGCGVVIGPEGGFDPAERDMLLARPNVRRLSLGPRILRADTAAVAALAIVQAVLGDWR